MCTVPPEQVWKMPPAKGLLRFHRRQGYEEKRQKDAHRILAHPTQPMLIVPTHSGDIPRGLFLRILKDAGFTEDDFFGSKKMKGKS